MRIFYRVISLIVAILIAVFAVSNRAPVTLSLWPLPYELDLPLFVPIMLALLIGLGAGLAYEWLINGKHRRAARRLDGELRRIKSRDDEMAVSATPAAHTTANAASGSLAETIPASQTAP